MNQPDLQFENPGTICVMQPLTPKAKHWIRKHVAYESWQLVGSSGIAIDQHLAGDLKSQATAFGLTLKE